MLGIDPGPFTLRRLLVMARARQEAEWDRASWQVASVASMFGDNVSPDSINPLRIAERQANCDPETDPDTMTARRTITWLGYLFDKRK